MKGFIKVFILSIICAAIIYSVSLSILNTLVVFACVFLFLFINEIYSIQVNSSRNLQFKKYEDKLKKCKDDNKKLERLLTYRSELDVGLIHLDGVGKIEYFNEYFSNNIYNLNIDYYSQIDNDQVYNVIYDVFNGKKVFNSVKINNKYFAIKYKVVEKHREIKSVAIQFYDITKTEQLDKLHQSFLVDASHELNNPLASIVMASEIIDRENKSEFSEILIKESYRMKNVIDNIIEHSKLQTSKFEMYELNLSELCLKYNDIYSKRSIVFNADVEEGIYIEGNYDLIDRMFKNLIDNAFKYTVEGEVNLKVYMEGSRVKCIVSDTGIGINSSNVDSIFNRFYREDSSRSRNTGGSGIGLAIVKEIASVHDIVIDVTSEVDKGTKFTLTI